MNKEKKVHFSEETIFIEKKEGLNQNSHEGSQERKWNEKNKNFKRGKFEEYEQKILLDSICLFAKMNGFGEGDLKRLITQSAKDSPGVWPKIAEKLPWRSVQSCHNYCKRHFNPDNYKGRWSKAEEERLLNLVSKFGKKWILLSNELDRTPNNIRDKFKELGAENHTERNTGKWSLREIYSLLDLIQKDMNEKFLDDGILEYINRKELEKTNDDALSVKSELTENSKASLIQFKFRNKLFNG